MSGDAVSAAYAAQLAAQVKEEPRLLKHLHVVKYTSSQGSGDNRGAMYFVSDE
jgi:hypothetical protein